MEGEERRLDAGSASKWLMLGSALAWMVGLLAGWNGQVAIALILFAVVVGAIAARPANLLVILVLSVILEALTLGGVTVSRVVAPLALVVVLIESLRGRTRMPHALAPVVWAVAYAIWAAASAFWTFSAEGTTIAVQSLAIALIYAAAFALLIRDRATLTLVLWVFTMGALVVGFVSVVELSGRLSVFPATVADGRAQGGVGNANVFAAVQLVALPLAFALLTGARSRFGQFLLLSALVIIPASVMGSLSRGGSIGLVVILLVFIVAPAGTFVPRREKWLVLTVLFLATALLLTRPTFGSSVTDRLGLTQSPSATVSVRSSNTGSGRTEIWLTAWEQAKRHPVLGIGFGAFKPLSNGLFFETPGFNPDEKVIRPDGAEVHNTYLSTLTELGIVGLVFLVGLLTATVLELRRIARRSFAAGDVVLGRTANAILLSLVGWQVTGVFNEFVAARPGWILIGLTLALSAISRRGQLRGQ